jgi:hypothetical protein
MKGNSRVLGTLALMGAILGMAQNKHDGIPMPAPSFGHGKYRHRRKKELSPAQLKLRKLRKRIENKSRAINAQIRRAA